MAAGKKKKSVNPFDVWNNKKILAHFVWDDGEDNLKGDPDGIFELVEVSSGSFPKFAVRFVAQQMPGFWAGVILKSAGDRASPSVQRMRKLDSLGSDDMLFAVKKVVVEAKKKKTGMRRLEGELDVPIKGGKSTTRQQVRMVYIKGVLEPDIAGNPMRDFVVIVFRDPAGGEDPNGGGSGPPDL